MAACSLEKLAWAVQCCGLLAVRASSDRSAGSSWRGACSRRPGWSVLGWRGAWWLLQRSRAVVVSWWSSGCFSFGGVLWLPQLSLRSWVARCFRRSIPVGSSLPGVIAAELMSSAPFWGERDATDSVPAAAREAGLGVSPRSNLPLASSHGECGPTRGADSGSFLMGGIGVLLSKGPDSLVKRKFMRRGAESDEESDGCDGAQDSARVRLRNTY